MRKNENWFSVCLSHMGAKKKLVARILKSEPLILKSKPLIFCPLKTRPASAGDQWPFGHKTVCYMPRKCRQNADTVRGTGRCTTCAAYMRLHEPHSRMRLQGLRGAACFTPACAQCGKALPTASRPASRRAAVRAALPCRRRKGNCPVLLLSRPTHPGP